MSLVVYNTLTREKETFTPEDASNVRMYVCGPTVYDCAHIGNARPAVVFDTLYRLLKHLYGKDHVTYARNLTDVDDKINVRAFERGIPISELTAETIAIYHEDMDALGVERPDVEPRATEHIDEMIAMMASLIDKGHAYAAEGHVLFDVKSMPDYGTLSGRSIDDMIAGARVEVAPYKKDPMDFVLWKPSKENEPAWESPWGPGRPGWHIECSAMSEKHLGKTFDIHGGGIDLTFPHHENEIAQSRCTHGTHYMAKYWMHNGFLQVEGEKMSKSLGNFVTVHELLGGWQGRVWPGQAIRLALLSSHYRKPIDFSQKALTDAINHLQRWSDALQKVCAANGRSEEELFAASAEPNADIVKLLSDDLNTAAVIGIISQQASKLRKSANWDDALALVAGMRLLGVELKTPLHTYTMDMSVRLGGEGDEKRRQAITLAFLSYKARMLNGIDKAEAETRLNEIASEQGLIFEGCNDAGKGRFKPANASRALSEEEIEAQIRARLKARADKDFAESDRIRDALAAQGIVLKDSKNKETGELETSWELQ